MEPVEAITGGMEPVDVGKIPGVDRGVYYVEESVGKVYDTVMSVLAPYQGIDPLMIVLLLFLAKFLISIPLGDVFKAQKDTCYNPDKVCGNTFSTFALIVDTILAVMFLVFWVRVAASGFKMAGFFSVRAYLPLFTTVIITYLAIWALKAFRIISKKHYALSYGGSKVVVVGGTDIEPLSVWHLIQVNIAENFKLFGSWVGVNADPPYDDYANGSKLVANGNVYFSLIYILVVAAILTLAGKV